MNEKHRNKKELGRYYTPQEVADALTEWAIQDSATTILDPSFGGCAFLYAALRTFQQRGVDQPGRQVYGVDIDPEATAYLSPLLEAGGTPEQFVIADFFELRPQDLVGAPFGAVVGNPPYVRHHVIDNAARQKAAASLAEVGLSISGRASYWAFFVLHSLRFLRANGRLAMVLPGSLLRSDYAVQVREYLAKSFRRLTVLLLQELIFQDAQAETVLLLAEGLGQPPEGVWVGTLGSVCELKPTCAALTQATIKLEHLDSNSEWLHGLLDIETFKLFNELSQRPQVVRLGEWLTPSIGVVTGNNHFFIMSKLTQKSKGISDKHVQPILTRAVQLKGLCIRDADIEQVVESGKDALLLSISATDSLSEGLERYLSEGKKSGASDRYKCRSREPWYVVPNRFAPAGFIQYMTATWPRVILNYSEVTCTNTIHRLVSTEDRPMIDCQRLALGSLSTLTQLAAELAGRSYGGGVLKLEPSDVSQLVVPIDSPVDIAELFSKVDDLLRSGQAQTATELVDQAFLAEGMGLNQEDIAKLRGGRDKLFRLRNTRGVRYQNLIE